MLTSISKYGKTILPYFRDLLVYLENMDTDPSIVFPDAHSAALTLSNFTDTLIVAELKVKAFNEHLLDITVRRDLLLGVEEEKEKKRKKKKGGVRGNKGRERKEKR